MNRRQFINNKFAGFLSLLGISAVITQNTSRQAAHADSTACEASPSEAAGPFIIKSPDTLIRKNIVSDRKGISLTVSIKVENTTDSCRPLESVWVDLWQCDAQGNYSEYNRQLQGDFVSANFLRGRQSTDQFGHVTFHSIYPGWYPGRAPHLHIEVLNQDGLSLLTTQTAFPESISKRVYTTSNYNGIHDTPNTNDFAFNRGVENNLPTSIKGDIELGFKMDYTLRVPA